MKYLRRTLLALTAVLLFFITTLSATYVIMDRTLLTPEVGRQLIEEIRPGEYVIDELYGAPLDKGLLAIKTTHIDPKTQAYGMETLSVERLRQLFHNHVAKEDVVKALNRLCGDSYGYIMEDNAKMPMVDIGFLIQGAGAAVTELTEDYLENNGLPTTEALAEILEKAYDLGIINDSSVDLLMKFMVGTGLGTEDMTQSTMKAFLEANKENFKTGNFDSETLSTTYIRSLVMSALPLEEMDDAIGLDKLMADNDAIPSMLTALRSARQRVLPVVKRSLLISLIGVLLITLILSRRTHVFLGALGIVWGLSGAIGLFSALQGGLGSISPRIFSATLGIPAEAGISQGAIEGLRKAFVLTSGLSTAFYGGLLFLGVVLWLLGRRFRPLPEAASKEVNNEAKERSTGISNLTSVLLSVLCYAGLYLWLVAQWQPLLV